MHHLPTQTSTRSVFISKGAPEENINSSNTSVYVFGPISFGIGGSTAFMLVLCCGLACLPRRGHEKPHHTF